MYDFIKKKWGKTYVYSIFVHTHTPHTSHHPPLPPPTIMAEKEYPFVENSAHIPVCSLYTRGGTIYIGKVVHDVMLLQTIRTRDTLGALCFVTPVAKQGDFSYHCLVSPTAPSTTLLTEKERESLTRYVFYTSSFKAVVRDTVTHRQFKEISFFPVIGDVVETSTGRPYVITGFPKPYEWIYRGGLPVQTIMCSVEEKKE